MPAQDRQTLPLPSLRNIQSFLAVANALSIHQAAEQLNVTPSAVSHQIAALEAWLEFVTLQGLPAAVRDNVRHRATVEDSLVPEQRLMELMSEAGFARVERFYQLHLLGGWLAQKV